MLNAIADPELAQRIRDRIAGKPLRVEPAKAPKVKGPKALVMTYFSFNPRTNVYLLQLPLHLEQSKRFAPRPGMTAQQIKWRIAKDNERYYKMRDGVVASLQHYLPNGIEGLQSIDYVRLSPRAGNPKTEMDDDNLSACFKCVRDAVCAYARWGSAWRQHIKTIGQADGYLKQQGVKWNYTQAKCASNKRAHGIQIRLHCAPRTTE